MKHLLPPPRTWVRLFCFVVMGWLALSPAWAQQAAALTSNEAIEPEGGTSGHKLVLCTDGSIMGWGANYSGQLGTNPSSVATPTVIPWTNQPIIVRVANAAETSFAIDAAGNLWAWGSNSYGRLGLGSSITSTATPTQVPGIANVVSVCGGFYHTLALCADGTVWSWGHRTLGALGTGSTGATIVYTPQQISSLSNIRSLVSGDQFGLALNTSGNVWSWGRESQGELGLGYAYGTVSIQYTPAQITTLSNVRQIDATNVRAAAVLTNGTVYNWGNNAGGQLGLGNTTYTSSPALVNGVSDVAWIAMNTSATLARHTLGGSHVWGDNSYGALGVTSPAFASVPIVGPSMPANTQVSGQYTLFTSIEPTGTVKTWGGYPLGYTPSGTGVAPNGGSYTPTTPTGVCSAVPNADFSPCGLPQQRAFYQRPGATYEAARHGYTVSPAEIGTPGQSTTIDVSQAPYNGTLTLSGVYHVRGDVRFTNGTVNTANGTAFYINGQGGVYDEAQRVSLIVENSDLRLSNVSMQAQCNALWAGIVLGTNGQLHTQYGGRVERRCSIRDAFRAVTNNGLNGHYYLTYTDFINNGTGVYDYSRQASQVLSGEGAQLCTFQINDPTATSPLQYSGLNVYTVCGFIFNPIASNDAGNFGNAQFNGNTFTKLGTGVLGYAGNASFSNNTFASCWQAAAQNSWQPTQGTTWLPMAFSGSIVTIPPYLPTAYTTTANTPAYGFKTTVGYVLTGNTIRLVTPVPNTPPANTVASRRVGLMVFSQATAQGNAFTNLSTGIDAISGGYTYPTAYTFESNTFSNSYSAPSEGITFSLPGNFGNPGLNIAIRCNSFSASGAGSTGIWVKSGTVFPAALGSTSQPNGNNFSGIADATKRFVYDVANSTSFTYHRYDSSQEYFASPAPGTGTISQAGNLIYTSSGSMAQAVASKSVVLGTNANCGGSTMPGVYNRSANTAASSQSIDKAVALLADAYPNPANEAVSFTYNLPAEYAGAATQVVLLNLMGHVVATQALRSTNCRVMNVTVPLVERRALLHS